MVQQTTAMLERLTTEISRLDERSELSGYAAKAAADVLAENWRAALRDGAAPADLAQDVDHVIALLGLFKQRVWSEDLR